MQRLNQLPSFPDHFRQPPIWAAPGSGDSEAGADGKAGPQRSAGRTSLRIVVVEDEPLVRLDLEMLLSAAGHEVVGAVDSADQAVAAAARERPDLMLMDVRLQGARDGIDAAIEIWESLGIRSLFASANLDPSARSRASRANPVGFVEKPFVGAKLLAALPKTGD